MANIWEQAISILAGNLNSSLSYLITVVLSWPSRQAGNYQIFLKYIFQKENQMASPSQGWYKMEITYQHTCQACFFPCPKQWYVNFAWEAQRTMSGTQIAHETRDWRFSIWPLSHAWSFYFADTEHWKVKKK